MGRVVKLAEVRKSELVDCAQDLFLTKGYEETTVADIIARAGVSKGGFYHHFLSKEELLDALVARMSDAIIANARDVLDDEKLDALTKLNRFMARSQQWKVRATPELRGIYMLIASPANAPLYQRMVDAALKAVGPELTKLVEQGVREKIFDVPYPDIVAEMLMHIANARRTITIEALQLAERGEVSKGARLLEQRIRQEEMLIDRVLGLPKGSIRLAEPGAIRKMLAAMK